MTKKHQRHKFDVYVRGEVVASAEASDRGVALHEAIHYLLGYAADGEDAEIHGLTPDDYKTYLQKIAQVSL